MSRGHIIRLFVGGLSFLGLSWNVVSAQKVYWVQSTEQLRCADLDGANVTLLSSALDSPVGLTIDVAAGKLYWSEATGRIRRSRLNGTEIETIVDSADHPIWGIALDHSGGKVYWASPYGNRIQRANLDGSQLENVITPADSPQWVAVDPGAGKIYFTAAALEIRRANLDGTAMETIVTDMTEIRSIALDLLNDRLYWMRRDFTWANFPAIRRANLDGSNVETIVSWPPGQEVYLNGLTLAVERNEMYWTGTNEGIHRAALDGTGIVQLATPFQPRGIALDVSCCSPYGDTMPLPGGSATDCILEVDDLQCVLGEFVYSGSCSGADIYPCGGDGLVDVDDIVAELEAFTGSAACETQCP